MSFLDCLIVSIMVMVGLSVLLGLIMLTIFLIQTVPVLGWIALTVLMLLFMSYSTYVVTNDLF